MKKPIQFFFLIAVIACLVNFSSCYYDNLERLNPNTTCDSSGTITYSGVVKSIIDSNCNSCHSGTSPSGGISLDTYAAVKNEALTGQLYNSIIWSNTPSPMPKGASSKIDNCSIVKIKKWIDTNYLP